MEARAAWTPSDFLPELDVCDALEDGNDAAQDVISQPRDNATSQEGDTPEFDVLSIAGYSVGQIDALPTADRQKMRTRNTLPLFPTTISRSLQGSCSDVFYTHYSFLNLENLPNLTPRDVDVLDSQGCLRVPTRDILNEFLHQYFRHIHPLLPMIDEGEFWARYTEEASAETYIGGISLLLLQAMIFASCNVCQPRSPIARS